MTHTHAKGQGQRSLGVKVRVETDGQTDGRTEAIALAPVLMRSVKSQHDTCDSSKNRPHLAIACRRCDLKSYTNRSALFTGTSGRCPSAIGDQFS